MSLTETSPIATRHEIDHAPEDILPPYGHPRLDAIALSHILWGKRRFLARAVFCELVFGFLVAFVIPAQYQSSTRLMPPDNQSNSAMTMASLLSGAGNSLGAIGSDLLGLKSSGDMFIGVLQSRTVRDRIVQRFDLQKVYGTKLEEDACKKLAEHTGVTSDRKSGIITITVTDHSPQRAQAIAQAYVEELNQLVTELSTSAAHRERVFLEQRLTAVKLDLDESSRQFSQFASKNAAIDIKEQGKAMVGAAANLEGELIAAESELKSLQAIYADQNSRVRAAQARVTELRHQLDNLGGASPKAPSDAGKVNADSSDGDPVYPSIRELPLIGVTYADLYRRIEIQEAVYETLTKQYELAKVQEAKETPSVKVLDLADVPQRKSFPPRSEIILLCGCLGIVMSALWIWTRALWEQVDSVDPRKMFLQEIFDGINCRMPWATPNGSKLQMLTHRAWIKVAPKEKVDS